jgi:hypothetical protein
MKSALLAAQTLHTNAEKTLSSLSELSSSLLKDPDFPLPASPTQRMMSIGQGLSETHTTYFNTTQAALEQARREHRAAEEELDINSSLFHRINHSLTSRIELRSQVEDNLRQMRDLIGPRRRVPDELWSMIFWERVMEDEEEYGETWRDEKTPFTTLKLTWVCQLWRQIIVEQPSLWQYIALPRNVYLTPLQADRVKHFREHLKGYSPKFYMVHQSRGARNDGVHLQALLAGLPSMHRFEAQILPDPQPMQAFLNSIEIPIQRLVLISCPDGQQREIVVSLSYNAIKGVKSLECYGVQPCVDQARLDENQAQLDSLYVSLSELGNANLIFFLEASGVAKLNLKPWDEWSIGEDGVERDVLLTRLETVSAPLPVLKYAFNQHVLVPNLRTLTVDLDSDYNINDSLEFWTSFLSIHERRNNITTLEISHLPARGSSAEETSVMLSKFINHVTNVEDLTLTKEAVTPSLRGLADSKKIPSGMTTITITDSGDVTEDLVMAFLKVYYTKKREPLLLEIIDCSSISEEGSQRLDLAHDKLKETKAKKKRKTDG